MSATLASLFRRVFDARDLSWQVHASCAQVDPETFFPEKGDSHKPAKRICAGCPVKAECLEAALLTGEKHGVWGGESTTARNALRNAA